MQLPSPRGPLSHRVLESLSSGAPVAAETEVPSGIDVLGDDAQITLWTLQELSYRGFDEVDDERELDPGVTTLLRDLERAVEQHLRDVTGPLVDAVPDGGDMGTVLLDLVSRDDGPSVAAYVRREADADEVLSLLRQRSLTQLKESDAYGFVLPRIDGAPKVALAELQYDEYGAGRPARLHQRMYADALAAAGLDPTYGAYVDETMASTLATGTTITMFARQRRLRGAALGHLAAFEATSPTGSRKIAQGMDRLGFEPAVSAYYWEHVEADSVHEQVAAHDICGGLVAQQPHLRADVLLGAAACLHLDALAARDQLDAWAAREAIAS